MGTNYYCELNETERVVCDCGFEHEMPRKLHIGKNSCGWVFTLHGYKDLDTYEAWEKTLRGARRIYDEYGEDVDVDTMLRLIDKPGRPLTRDELEDLAERAREDATCRLEIVDGLLWNTGCRKLQGMNCAVEYGEFC